MSDRYVIQWKSLENGRVGRGSKIFSRQDAQDLARELNVQFPRIQHEAVKADTASAGHENGRAERERGPGAGVAQTQREPTPVLARSTTVWR